MKSRPPRLSASALLQLIWLASPALPIGGFSYSEGLEMAIETGLVRDEATAANWLCDQLHLSQARADLAVLARAIAGWRRNDMARIRELNDWVLMTRETAEFRQQSEQMGRSLVEWLRDRSTDLGRLDDFRAHRPTYPVAFALAVATTVPDNVPVRDALLAFTFGWAENQVQAAVKAVPLGQSAGQRLLERLRNEIPAAVDRAASLSDSQRQAFSPMLAILSAQHETQYSRLFRS